MADDTMLAPQATPSPSAASTPVPISMPGGVLLVSCYELGHQPLSLASPLAALRRAGFAPAAVDTAVSALDDAAIARAWLVAIAVPMHTALRLGARIAARARALNPAAHICFYGLYAALNADELLRELADSTVAGEYEEALVGLARALAAGEAPETVLGVRTREHEAPPVLARLPFAAPARESLPSPRHYAHLVHEGAAVPAGYVEASRGCLHTCRHCPITPVYGGRFFIVPRETVLADVRAQVAAGARHITFGDPDFLNGPGHSLAIVRALHAEHPDVTWDATIKIEHIIERREMFAEFAALGCVFVVSAVESLSPAVLRHLKKGHTREDVVTALGILDAAGIPMRPTFVTFTPWTTADDYLELLDFVAAHDLIGAVDPVQYSIRLLVPPGSALLEEPDAAGWLGPLEAERFTYCWEHSDPRMDRLQTEVAALVERAAREGALVEDAFAAVRALAEETLDLVPTVVVSGAAQQPSLPRAGGRSRHPVPHLTEAWFC